MPIFSCSQNYFYTVNISRNLGFFHVQIYEILKILTINFYPGLIKSCESFKLMIKIFTKDLNLKFFLFN